MSAVVVNHVRFISLRMCNFHKMPQVNDEKFLNEFNHGFSKAIKSIGDITDVYDLEDVYTTALNVMKEYEKDSDTARRIIVIINKRLEMLGTLS